MGLIGILIVIVCIVLILIVLVQNSKGGGLTSNFSSSNQILGVAKTKDILEQITWGAAILLFVLCLLATPKSKAAPTAGAGDGKAGDKNTAATGPTKQSITKTKATSFPTGTPNPNLKPNSPPPGATTGK